MPVKKIWMVFLTFVLLGAASAAFAQKPTNPRTLEFTPSVDHAAASGYTLGYFLPGATDPVQTVSLGKPTPNAQNVCTATINTMPLAFGLDYTGKLKTIISPGLESEWSEPSNPFDRVPGPPGKPAIK